MLEEVTSDLKKVDSQIKNLSQSPAKQLEFKKRKDSSKVYKVHETFYNYDENSGFPIKKSYEEDFDELFTHGIIKPFENKNFKDRFISILKGPEVQKLTEMLFWLVFVSKFPSQVHDISGIEVLRYNIGDVYTRLFHSLPRPKENFSVNLVFIMTYVIHKAFFDTFVEDRELFNLRFVIDCYHIVIIQLNGVTVTDFYIQLFIDRIFSYKFMDYFREKNKKKKQQLQ